MDNNVFKKKEKRDIIKPIIEEELKILDTKLQQLPKTEYNVNISKLPISKQFLNDVYSIYMQDNSVEDDDGIPEGDGLVHENTLFSAAMMPNSDKLKREVTLPFRNALKDAVYIDKKPLEQRPHIKFYDDKARNIWKNLAIGTNMAILHDKNNYPSHLINSFLHLFNDSQNGFGKLTKNNTKLTKNNTKILNLNNEGFIDDSYLANKLKICSKIGEQNNRLKNKKNLNSLITLFLKLLQQQNAV